MVNELESLICDYNVAVANGLMLEAKRLDRVIQALDKRLLDPLEYDIPSNNN